NVARRRPLSHCGAHLSCEEFEDGTGRVGPKRVEGLSFFHKAPLYLWTLSRRRGMDIAASSNADQNWRRWPCRYYRRSGEKAYHPSLGTRRVNRWDLYGLTLIGKPSGKPRWRARL